MYFYVLRSLYDKNSQLLLNGQDVIKITRNAEDFRAAQELANGWYIESNIDSNSKFSVLKKLLTLFELEEELIIKYYTGPVSNGGTGRHNFRRKYWQQLLPMLQNIQLFQNINATKDHWLSSGARVSGIQYTLSNTKSRARIELGILTSSKEINKSYFKRLFSKKELIEEAFGYPLEWQELPENKMSRIKIESNDIDFFDENKWEERNNFFIEILPKFQEAFGPFVKELK